MESRIEDLEIRFAHQELALEGLSRQIHDQENVIAELRAQVKYLYTQLKSMAPSQIASPAEETPPPHY